jgi:hypothetical protein
MGMTRSLLLPVLLILSPADAWASCAAPNACPCDLVDGRVAVRGTVTLSEPVFRVEVTEVFGQADGVEVGALVGGSLDAGVCAAGAVLPAVGDDVLVLYRRGNADSYPGCVEYLECTLDQCGTSSDPAWDACDGQCVVATRDVCRTHSEEALLSGGLYFVPWADPLEFTDGELAVADVAKLAGGEGCLDVLPRPGAGFCKDVVSLQDTGCAAGQGGQPLIWLLGMAVLALLGWRRLTIAA